ncbi:MAG: hypothetical protein LBK95_19720 [Bifidobacteriaceae bacterium]|jgi:alpha-tubulin suppressor-like RCC1 family protein|nr:hypothetical protein [Bifidobacteriaceae bacterium]
MLKRQSWLKVLVAALSGVLVMAVAMVAQPPGTAGAVERQTSALGRTAAGGNHSLAADGSGRVWAWGRNNAGQLGDGTGQDSTEPVLVAGLSDVVAVAAGNDHSLAVTGTGEVWAWGSNALGQLGDGTAFERLSPVEVPCLPDVVAVVAGGNRSLAVTGSGQVYEWGSTHPVRKLSPTLVPGLSDVVAAATGSGHSLAMTASGQVYGWGQNSFGQIGDGTTNDRVSPALVVGLSEVVAVSAYAARSLAATRSGQVYEWVPAVMTSSTTTPSATESEWLAPIHRRFSLRGWPVSQWSPPICGVLWRSLISDRCTHGGSGIPTTGGVRQWVAGLIDLQF